MPSEPGTLNFPTSLDDVISLVEAANHASAVLNSGINNSVLLVPVSQPSEFSASGYATILDVVPNPTVIEIVKYTSKSGNDLVVPTGGRGQQGTSAAAFSAGAVVEQRPTQRHHGVLRDAIIEIEKKIGYGNVFAPLDASGTNQAGVDNDFSGGRGTGTGIPGNMRVRYPLIGATGTTLHALSNTSDDFVPTTSAYSNTSNGTAIANSASETSLFTGAGVSAGSTRTIEGGIARAGAVYRIVIAGDFGATSGPTGRIKFKLGSTIIADTNTFTMPNCSPGAGIYTIEFDLLINSVGATGTASVRALRGTFSPGSGGQTPTFAFASGAPTVDFTANQTMDITFQWGTANSNNTIILTMASIQRIR
jgi:hypothetical protein